MCFGRSKFPNAETNSEDGVSQIARSRCQNNESSKDEIRRLEAPSRGASYPSEITDGQEKGERTRRRRIQTSQEESQRNTQADRQGENAGGPQASHSREE